MKKNDAGFTLIELMVVTVIIAILAVIGITVYTNAQRSVRNGVRRAEITSLAKSIEATKNIATNLYNYDSTLYANDFTSIKPKDPRKTACSSTNACYCYLVSTSPIATDASGSLGSNGCASSYSVLVNETGVYQASTALSNVKYWKVCAYLETGSTNTYYCVGSGTP